MDFSGKLKKQTEQVLDRTSIDRRLFGLQVERENSQTPNTRQRLRRCDVSHSIRKMKDSHTLMIVLCGKSNGQVRMICRDIEIISRPTTVLLVLLSSSTITRATVVLIVVRVQQQYEVRHTTNSSTFTMILSIL